MGDKRVLVHCRPAVKLSREKERTTSNEYNVWSAKQLITNKANPRNELLQMFLMLFRKMKLSYLLIPIIVRSETYLVLPNYRYSKQHLATINMVNIHAPFPSGK